jgi:hypothetical protein
MQILDPRNPCADEIIELHTLETLSGKRLAYLNNGWLSMARIGKLIEGDLKGRHGVADITYYDVPRNMEPPDGLLDLVAEEFDAAIVGMAN